MFWLIVGVIVGALILFAIIYGIYYATVSKKRNREFEEKLCGMGFNIDRKFDNFESIMYVDNQNKLWSIKESNKSQVAIYKFSDLVMFELKDDGRCVAIGNAWSVLEGNIRFSNTNAAKFKAECKSLILIVEVKDQESPIKQMKIINSSTKTNSDSYVEKVTLTEEILTTLVRIMNITIPERTNEIPHTIDDTVAESPALEPRVSVEQRGKASGQSTAEKMRQLAKLRNDNLISEEEYNFKREELLKRM